MKKSILDYLEDTDSEKFWEFKFNEGTYSREIPQTMENPAEGGEYEERGWEGSSLKSPKDMIEWFLDNDILEDMIEDKDDEEYDGDDKTPSKLQKLKESTPDKILNILVSKAKKYGLIDFLELIDSDITGDSVKDQDVDIDFEKGKITFWLDCNADDPK